MDLQHIKRDALRFVVGGGLNTAVSYSMYLLLNLVLPYMYAYGIAYVMGILFSYVLSAKWVFRVGMSWKTFALFPLVYAVQFSLTSGLVWLLVEKAHISETLAPLLAIGAALPVTFLMSRYILKPVVAVDDIAVKQ